MQFYNTAKKKFMDGGINLPADTIKWVLLTSVYTPNIDTHEFYAALTNELATANGYTNGGIALAGKATTVEAATDLGKFDATDGSLTLSGGITFRYIVLFKDTGSGATSPLIALHDFGANVSPAAGTLDFVWNVLGIFNFV